MEVVPWQVSRVARSSSSRPCARRSAAGTRRRATTRTSTPTTCWARPTPRSSSASGIDPAEVEDVIAGCVQQFGEQAFNVARNAWLQEGLPIETAATTVDRQCGSAQQAVNFGAALIASGVHDVVIGSGVEHMGHLPFAVGMETQQQYGAAFTPEAHGEAQHRRPGPGRRDDRRPVGDPALRARRARRALAPQGRARPPRRAGSSARSCPSRSTATPTSPTRASARTRSLEALAELKPAFKPDGKITAGNSLADLRRRRRRAAHVAREGRRARAAAAGADRRPDDRRLRPGEDARGPDPGDGEAPASATG